MDQRKRKTFHQFNSIRDNSIAILGFGVGRPQSGGSVLINLHKSIIFRDPILHFLNILCDLLRPLCLICLQVLYSAHARYLSSIPQKNIGQLAHLSLHYRMVHNLSPKGNFQDSSARNLRKPLHNAQPHLFCNNLQFYSHRRIYIFPYCDLPSS